MGPKPGRSPRAGWFLDAGLTFPGREDFPSEKGLGISVVWLCKEPEMPPGGHQA